MDKEGKGAQRIAKNTLALYIRQILLLGVNLYAVRVLLGTLGAEDYGIYNVVAGVVAMFGFFSGAMATASQRYFAFELGRGDGEALQKTFSATMIIYALLALAVVLLGETAGLWFVHNKLEIPAGRVTAAKWIYQFSILTCAVSVISTPYMSLILSYERMDIYAWGSILEAILKLLIVYLLKIIPYDKLFVYGLLILFVTVFTTTAYRFYCRYYFPESRFSFYWDTRILKEIIGFTGWFFFSMFSGAIQTQAVSILCNMFFGPAVNAAQGIAVKIRAVSDTFANNFSVAARPQIIQSYASNDYAKMFELLYRACKTTYYLTLIIVVSLISDIEMILQVWLVEVPAHTLNFAKLLMIESLISSVAFAMSSANQAAGKVKWYCLSLGGVALVSVPFMYLFLRLGMAAETVYYITIAVQIILTAIRTFYLKNIPGFSLREAIKKVYAPVIITSVPAGIIAVLLKTNSGSVSLLILMAACRFILAAAVVCAVGFSRSERAFLLQMLKLDKIFRGYKDGRSHRGA